MSLPFFPTALAGSAFEIDYPLLWQKGYRGLIFDIDATLVPHGADATPEVERLFERLHELGFDTLLLSNNDEERVQRFLTNISSKYICDADKPNPSGYQRALRMMGLSGEEVLCVGDQLFTDILGAGRAGLKSILVPYLLWPGETRLGLRRRLEGVLLWLYKRRRHEL